MSTMALHDAFVLAQLLMAALVVGGGALLLLGLYGLIAFAIDHLNEPPEE